MSASTDPHVDLSTLDPAADSVDRILRALAPHVRTWIYRQLGPGAELDDATQEALIQIADALPDFEGRSKLTTYARRIAIRAALRHAQRNPRPRAADLVPVADELDPEKLVLQRESLRRFYAALDQLSPKLRTAYILCDVERVPHLEAARISEIDVEAVRARVKRARTQLRELLRHDAHLAPLFEGRS